MCFHTTTWDTNVGGGYKLASFWGSPRQGGEVSERGYSYKSLISIVRHYQEGSDLSDILTDSKTGSFSLCPADYPEAVSFYTEALKVYPTSCKQEIAVCYANRGACHLKMVRIKW